MARAAFALWLAAAACGRIGFGDLAGDAKPGDGTSSAVLDAAIQPPEFIQHTATQNAGNQVAIATFGSAVAADDLIIAGIDFGYSGTPPTLTGVTDSVGGTYAFVGPFDGMVPTGIPTRLYIAYAIMAESGTATVQAALDSESTSFFELRIHEYASTSLTDPFDSAAGSAGTNAGSDSASELATTTEPNELIFAMAIDDIVTVGTGFTARGPDFDDLTEDMIAPTPAVYDVVATTNGEWVLANAVFRGR
jgi:hypothetical protein